MEHSALSSEAQGRVRSHHVYCTATLPVSVLATGPLSFLVNTANQEPGWQRVEALRALGACRLVSCDWHNAAADALRDLQVLMPSHSCCLLALCGLGGTLRLPAMSKLVLSRLRAAPVLPTTTLLPSLTELDLSDCGWLTCDWLCALLVPCTHAHEPQSSLRLPDLHTLRLSRCTNERLDSDRGKLGAALATYARQLRLLDLEGSLVNSASLRVLAPMLVRLESLQLSGWGLWTEELDVDLQAVLQCLARHGKLQVLGLRSLPVLSELQQELSVILQPLAGVLRQLDVSKSNIDEHEHNALTLLLTDPPHIAPDILHEERLLMWPCLNLSDNICGCPDLYECPASDAHCTWLQFNRFLRELCLPRLTGDGDLIDDHIEEVIAVLGERFGVVWIYSSGGHVMVPVSRRLTDAIHGHWVPHSTLAGAVGVSEQADWRAQQKRVADQSCDLAHAFSNFISDCGDFAPRRLFHVVWDEQKDSDEDEDEEATDMDEPEPARPFWSNWRSRYFVDPIEENTACCAAALANVCTAQWHTQCVTQHAQGLDNPRLPELLRVKLLKIADPLGGDAPTLAEPPPAVVCEPQLAPSWLRAGSLCSLWKSDCPCRTARAAARAAPALSFSDHLGMAPSSPVRACAHSMELYAQVPCVQLASMWTMHELCKEEHNHNQVPRVTDWFSDWLGPVLSAAGAAVASMRTSHDAALALEYCWLLHGLCSNTDRAELAVRRGAARLVLDCLNHRSEEVQLAGCAALSSLFEPISLTAGTQVLADHWTTIAAVTAAMRLHPRNAALYQHAACALSRAPIRAWRLGALVSTPYLGPGDVELLVDGLWIHNTQPAALAQGAAALQWLITGELAPLVGGVEKAVEAGVLQAVTNALRRHLGINGVGHPGFQIAACKLIQTLCTSRPAVAELAERAGTHDYALQLSTSSPDSALVGFWSRAACMAISSQL